MKAALLSLALLGDPEVILISDSVPHLNVEALCKSTAADDKAMGLAESQSFADCMRDETTAQQQLGSLWAATARPTRDRCEGEAVAGGFQSYVDLLTCIQAADIVNASSPPSTLRGGSKNRNAR